MNKPKVRKVYLKILALLVCPFILSGCSEQAECNIAEDHVHKYVGSNKKGTVVTFIKSEDLVIQDGYEDGSFKIFDYKRQDDYETMTEEDKGFFEIKGIKLFKGSDNWDYLYNVMASKKDRIEYRYRYDDGFDYSYNWIESNKENKHYTGDVRVYHYRFCGHRIVLKDGKWVDERSPFVDDIRDIIDDYPYFQLDPYKVFTKDYTVNPNDIPNTWLADVNSFKGPDLENKELHPNIK